MSVEAVFMLVPMLVALLYGEYRDVLYFGGTIAVTAIIALLCTRVKGESLNSRDGYVIVASAWLIISVIGAVPLYLTGAFSDYVSALFEIISGFTTTGASVMDEPGVLGHGMQFFRCFSHWIGGMGVLVFVLMILPMVRWSSIQARLLQQRQLRLWI